MRSIASKLLLASTVVIGSVSGANAGFFRPIPPPSLQSLPDATVTAINDNGDIGGTFSTGGNTYGFVLLFNGTGEPQRIQAPANGLRLHYNVSVRGISNSGWIVGYLVQPNLPCLGMTNDSGCFGFVREPGTGLVHVLQDGNGVGTPFAGTAILDASIGGQIFVGEGPHSAGRTYGVRGTFRNGATTLSEWMNHGYYQLRPRGINSEGEVVGFYLSKKDERIKSFLRNAQGQYTCYDSKKYVVKFASINDTGEIVGNLIDDKGSVFHAVVRDANLAWKDLAVPGDAAPQAFQVNRFGQIAISSSNGNYVYCPSAGPGWCEEAFRPSSDKQSDETPSSVEESSCAVPH